MPLWANTDYAREVSQLGAVRQKLHSSSVVVPFRHQLRGVVQTKCYALQRPGTWNPGNSDPSTTPNNNT